MPQDLALAFNIAKEKKELLITDGISWYNIYPTADIDSSSR